MACGADYPAPLPGVTICCPGCGSKDRDEYDPAEEDRVRRGNLLAEAFGMVEVMAEAYVDHLKATASPVLPHASALLTEAKRKADEAMRE